MLYFLSIPKLASDCSLAIHFLKLALRQLMLKLCKRFGPFVHKHHKLKNCFARRIISLC